MFFESTCTAVLHEERIVTLFFVGFLSAECVLSQFLYCYFFEGRFKKSNQPFSHLTSHISLPLIQTPMYPYNPAYRWYTV